MAHGLEGRTPLLDPVVGDFGFCLPEGLKLARGRGKYLMRRWLEEHVPNSPAFARKKGFTVPVGDWIAARSDELGPLVAGDPPSRRSPRQTRSRPSSRAATGTLWRPPGASCSSPCGIAGTSAASPPTAMSSNAWLILSDSLQLRVGQLRVGTSRMNEGCAQTTMLILPGLGDSGLSHWQTLWQISTPGARRVEQRMRTIRCCPNGSDTLQEAVVRAPSPVVLVATAWLRPGRPLGAQRRHRTRRRRHAGGAGRRRAGSPGRRPPPGAWRRFPATPCRSPPWSSPAATTAMSTSRAPGNSPRPGAPNSSMSAAPAISTANRASAPGPRAGIC